jgi:hypothetical protein
MSLQEDYSADSSPRRRRRGPVSPGVTLLLSLAFVGLLILRHDWWNWSSAKPMLFGLLPVGLWWQAMVSLLACGLMWLTTTLAWPDHLE